MNSRTRSVAGIGLGIFVVAVAITVVSFFRYGTVEHDTSAIDTAFAPGPLPTSIALVDQSIQGLNWGNIVFNAPATMRFGEPRTVELLLSPSLSPAELQAQLNQRADAEAAHIRISNRMEAQLTGRGFSIQAETPDLQAVGSHEATRWNWEVTATEHGQRSLHLALSAHIDVGGRDAPLVVRTFDRNVRVEITVPQRVSTFAKENWQWLWAAVAVPIAGYLWKRTRRRIPKPKGRNSRVHR